MGQIVRRFSEVCKPQHNLGAKNFADDALAPLAYLAKMPAMQPNRIKLLRKRAGLTQTALAERAGLNFQHLSRLERGDVSLTPRYMELLAPHLGVRPAALIDAEAERLPDAKRDSEIVEDPDELALLRLWRDMPSAMRTAVADMLAANVAAIRGAAKVA